MPACDICNEPPGPSAKRYSAAQLRSAVETGYRPKVAIEHHKRLSSQLGLNLSDDHWFGEWVAQVRRDQTDWLLCQSCGAGLEAHLQRRAGAPPQLPPQPQPRLRRSLFGWRR
jgi:hypothetical protein